MEEIISLIQKAKKVRFNVNSNYRAKTYSHYGTGHYNDVIFPGHDGRNMIVEMELLMNSQLCINVKIDIQDIPIGEAILSLLSIKDQF